jgi:hypothetical protein
LAKLVFTKLVYKIKEFVQPKMSLNREFLIWKEREGGVREREGGVGGRAGGQVSRQAGIFKVTLGLGEI